METDRVHILIPFLLMSIFR